VLLVVVVLAYHLLLADRERIFRYLYLYWLEYGMT
jgi:hypothetical protein